MMWVLSGCVGEQEPFHAEANVKLQSSECLSETATVATAFFKGHASASEVESTWNCIHSALWMFSTYVKGAEDGSYRPEELRTFLQTYFLGDLKISNELMAEAMAIKQLFVSGSQSRITQKELQLTLKMIAEFKKVTLGLRPHMKLITGLAEQPVTIREIEGAEQSVTQALVDLAELMQTHGGAYDLGRLRELLKTLQETIGGAKDPWNKGQSLVPLLQVVKVLITGQEGSEITASHWQSIVQPFSQMHRAWLQYHYLVPSENGWSKIQGVESLKNIFSIVDDLAKHVIRSQPKESVHQDLLLRVLSALEQGGLLPLNISASAMAEAIDVVMPKQDLDLSLWDDFSLEVFDWLEVQGRLVSGEKYNDTLAGALFSRLLNSPWPIVNDDEERVIIPHRSSQFEHSARSLTRLHLESVLVRWVIHFFSEDKAQRSEVVGLSQKELGRAYLKLQPILVDLGVVTKEDLGFYKSVFNYANLFMPSSDGNADIGFVEGVEYFHFVLSGVNSGRLVQEKMQGRCAINSSFVTSGSLYYSASCMAKELHQHFEMYYPNLPGLVAFSVSLSEEKWQSFFSDLMATVADKKVFEQGYVLSKDVNAFSIFLLYLETIMQRFDRDDDERLDIYESLNAYPLFQRTLEGLVGEIYGRPLFTYMLRFGYNPLNEEDSTPITPVRWRYWRWHPELWEVSAGRHTLAAIMASLRPMLDGF